MLFRDILLLELLDHPVSECTDKDTKVTEYSWCIRTIPKPVTPAPAPVSPPPRRSKKKK